MMEGIKRWICGVLVCCILMALTPMAAFAGGEVVASGTCGDDLIWTLDDDGVLTISGTGAMSGAPWDSLRSRIKTVVVEPGVTSIGSYAFSECNSLTSVTLPEGLISIRDDAFSGCVSLTSVIIPQSVTRIGYRVFASCDSLQGIWVDPDNEYYSNDEYGVLFDKNKGTLRQAPGAIAGEYVAPWGLSEVDSGAFYRCANLVSVTFPDSLTSIGTNAFSGCISLTNVTIPDSVIAIEESAFSECTSLTNISLPEELASIEASLFSGCTSLIDVKLPSGLTSIGNSAFYGCKVLTGVTFPEGLVSIGDSAFTGCDSLDSVFLPETLTSIGDYPFLYCESLQGIWVDPDNQYYSSDDRGVLFDKGKTLLIQAPGAISGEYCVPEGVVRVEDVAFSFCCGLTSVTMLEGVTSVGISAFRGCDSLVSVFLPEGLVAIEGIAFLECYSLTSVTIPGGLDIGDYAFGYCDNLERITFFGSAPRFCEDAFHRVTATAYYPAGDPTWTEDVRQDYGGTITWIPYDTDEQPGEDTPSEEPKVFCYSSDMMSELFGQDGPMEMSYTFDYDDGWFLENNQVYNHELARMSIRAAMAAFNSDTEQAGGDNAYYIKALMDDLGYDYDDDSIQYPDPTRYSIGYAIGSKDISDDTSVIMVAVRGGGYAAEWHNNVVVGKTGDHQGFDEASIQVGEGIGAYINAHKGDLKPNIKVWLVGFSRAAAVANLTAADLCDGFIDEISSDDVFAYCFACPQGTVDKNASSNKYSGIKNIVNPIDLVPKVAMTDWGFSRYGITYYFPFEGDTVEYSQFKDQMCARYDDLLAYNGMEDTAYRTETIKSLTAHSKGQAVAYEELVGYVAELIHRSDYTWNIQELVASAVDGFMGDGLSEEELLDAVISYIITTAANSVDSVDILSRIVTLGQIYPDAPENLSKLSNLMIAHYPELYLAWIDSLEGKYQNYNGKYRKVFVNCPIDVTVYDQNGTVCAQIIDDEVILSDDGVVAYVDTDGQKVLILPMDAEYEVGLTATDDGTMSYMVAEYDMECQSGKYSVSYYDIPIESGDVMTGSVTTTSEIEKVQYPLVEASGEVLEPTKELEGEEISMHSVDVVVDGHGTVKATPRKLAGEYVTLCAVANEGERFLGWYDREVLVSREEEYRIRVEGDISLDAIFTRLYHKEGEMIVTRAPTCTVPGVATYVCEVCGDSYDQEIPATHSWVSANCTEARHCSTCGLISGSAMGHHMVDAGCELPKHCTHCGVTEGEPLGHDYVVTTGICSQCGDRAPFSVETPRMELCYGSTQVKVKAQWTKVSGVDGYELYMSTDPDDLESFALVKSVLDPNTLSYTKGSLTPGVTYYFRVCAFVFLEDGITRVRSSLSNVKYCMPTVLWDAPYSNSDFRIRLRWEPVEGADGFQIWRKGEGEDYRVVKTLKDGGADAYSNVSLKAGGTYTYKMRAYFINEDGSKSYGAYSDEITVGVQPSKPKVTVVSTKAGRAQVSWEDLYGASAYQVWMSENPNGTFKIVKSIYDGDVTSYTKTGLVSGKTYYFKVRASVEIDGKKTFGAYSEVIAVTVK